MDVSSTANEIALAKISGLVTVLRLEDLSLVKDVGNKSDGNSKINARVCRLIGLVILYLLFFLKSMGTDV